MRVPVYRNFTFKAYVVDGDIRSVLRSDNFFTVESGVTQILKDNMAFNEPSRDYIIRQESKDGKYSRAIELVRRSGDTICISYVPGLLDIPTTEESTVEQETEESNEAEGK